MLLTKEAEKLNATEVLLRKVILLSIDEEVLQCLLSRRMAGPSGLGLGYSQGRFHDFSQDECTTKEWRNRLVK